MTPNKGESKEDFLKRCTADDCGDIWDKAQDTYAEVRDNETLEEFVKRFSENPAAVAIYADLAGRIAAAKVKYSAARPIQFGEINNVEIFSTGTWSGSKKITVTPAMLDSMVHAWTELNDKVTGYRPPLKLGHDDAQSFMRQNKGSGAPALGWVHNLRRVGNKIVADFKNVPSSLIDLIKLKRYNSVSIELLDSLKFNGATFNTVLTAVAILGAELPAVKGLQELSATLFAGEQPVILSEKEEDNMANYTQEQVDALVAAAVGKAKTEFDTAHSSALIKLQSDLKVATETAEQAQTALSAFKLEAENKEMSDFVDQAVKEGKVMPVEKDGLLAVGRAMASGGKVKLGDKETSGLVAWKDMITKRPVAINMQSRFHGKGERQDGELASVIVTQRANEKVSKAGGADKLSFKDAVSGVLAEDASLKQRYFEEV